MSSAPTSLKSHAMEIDAYSLALVAGGFTIVGAFISVVVAYWLTVKLDGVREHRAACAKFRTDFSSALGQIYLARHHGTHDTPVVGDILRNTLPDHAAAVEQFRPFVSDTGAFNKAWETYRKTVCQDNYAIDTAEWETSDPPWTDVEAKIHAILEFAKA